MHTKKSTMSKQVVGSQENNKMLSGFRAKRQLRLQNGAPIERAPPGYRNENENEKADFPRGPAYNYHLC